jgi:hypothetical protein
MPEGREGREEGDIDIYKYDPLSHQREIPSL